MSLPQKFYFRTFRFFVVALLVGGWLAQRAFADGISFNPASGNALTPMTVTVEGFIGTNGPAPVTVGGELSGFCNTTRPCSFQASMGNFSGKHWVTANANVDGVNVVVSNYFVVRDAKAFINRACGPSGTEIIVNGFDFARSNLVYVDNETVQTDATGRFAKKLIINSGTSGPYSIIAQDGFRFVTNEFHIGPTDDCPEEIGRVIDLTGSPTIRHPYGQPQPLNPGDPIHKNDEVKTGPEDKLEMLFLDDTTLTMAGTGHLTVNNYVYNPDNGQNDQSSFSILDGAFKYVSGFLHKEDHNVQVINPNFGNIGIRGTEFVSRRDPCSTTQEVYLIHGQLAINPTYSSVTNIVDAPATILFDATNVWTSGLTQAAYDAMVNLVNQTNPVTFASWLVQYFGCTNGNPSAAANADPDGDGQNNYAEFLAHTDPTTNASVFKLLSAAREGAGVRLGWQTHGGITNVVQGASSLNGSYADISSNLIIPGDADVTTNYLDAGVITNSAARFYRIRLAP